MAVLTSLLDAIVRADGDALVLHAGEHPYVVTPAGQVELSPRVLTLEGIASMLDDLLPPAVRRTLEEEGAVQHDLVAPTPFHHDRFTAVAAWGGDDIWVEIRRHRQPAVVPTPELPPEPSSPTAARVEAPVEAPVPATPARPSAPQQPPAGIERLLRMAAAAGASTLYLRSRGRPSIRVDGKISALEGETAIGESEVEALTLELVPEADRETRRRQPGVEWICEVSGVGLVRCTTFRDFRGAGGIFRMMPPRALSVEHLGLSQAVQDLCDEAEGLVLVAGPRSSGKTTLVAALVDLINRTRSEHVITLENEIQFVHEQQLSLVSQREVRGGHEEWQAAVRAALLEHPDVLVIEDLGSPDIVALAVEAAQSGRLVIGGLTAHTAAEALGRIIDQAPPESRAKVRAELAARLRGIVAQALVRRIGGGRVAAREVLLNTSEVADILAEGRLAELPTAFEGGSRFGMVSLDAALAALVERGDVDACDAYCLAADRPALLERIGRQGFDTSFAEKLA